MNVGELIAQLAKLPADMPVVVAQEDEPLGDYGVTGVERMRMKRDGFWPHRQVWEHAGRVHPSREPEAGVVEVCYLDTDEPPTQVVDAEVIAPADEREVDCPACGNPLRVSAVTLPGDHVACSRCQQIVELPPSIELRLPIEGPGWRALIDRHRGAIEGYDRDTRTLATADQAQAELNERPSAGVAAPPVEAPDHALTMAAALARLDAVTACERCFVCDQPTESLLCDQCKTIVGGGRRPPPLFGDEAET